MVDRREESRIEHELHRVDNGTDPFASAVRTTRMPMLITDPRQPDNPIVFVNDAFGRLTGYSRDETLNRNCRFLQGPATNRDDVGRVRDAVANRVPIEIDLLNYRKDGTTFWNRLLISPVFAADGDLMYFFASQFDVTAEINRLARLKTDRSSLEQELERRIADLSRTEERLRFTLDAGRLGAWAIDLKGGRVVASQRFRHMFGLEVADSVTQQDLESALHPADRLLWRAEMRAAMSGSGELEIESRILKEDDEELWIELRGQTSFDAQGDPILLSGVCADITERKRAELHRELLTRELDHRVKNVLATVQSIFSQTLRNAHSLDQAQETMAGRMQALAATHDVLTREGWAGALFGEVVARSLDPFRGEDGRVSERGPRVRLLPKVATALSLALHELATNAVKYGALSNETGRIDVSWRTFDVDGERRLAFEWREMGGPPINEAPTRRGFGSRMIERSLAAEIGEEMKIDYAREGLRFAFESPLSSLTE
ncbi:HWE histidine kinase domain-containing protein [Aureimonas mangrovi]|uniref:HWE histidine kinase domain-containing protein n=1 Tax=Aureimonas mangrovi TaxID=2758041 RepID=UPI00163D520B|nr:HWE histidine kinase domain-containing protein [Aureimonas mangrovi]